MAKREIPEINAGSMADIAFLLLIFFLVTTTMEKEKAMVRMLPKIQDKPLVEPETQVEAWNLLEVLVNKKGNLFVRGKVMEISDLKDITLDYYTTNRDVTTIEPGVLYRKPGKGQDFLSYMQLDLPYIDMKMEAMQDSVDKYESIPAPNEFDLFFADYYGSQIKYYEDRKMVYEELGQPYMVPADRLLIRVTNYTQTKYGDYLSVQNEIQSAIDQVRDEKCKELWNISYEKLKKALQEKNKPKAMEKAIKRKKILEILVPGKVVEKSKNV